MFMDDPDNIGCLPALRQSRVTWLVEKLRQQILTGEIPGGTRIHQSAVAARFHMSRFPVRDALQRLSAEGLITIRPYYGAFVATIDPRDAEELLSIATLLEPHLLEQSISRLSDGDFSKAEDRLYRRTTGQKGRLPISTWAQLHWEFHAALYVQANRPQVMAIMRKVYVGFERYARFENGLPNDKRIERANDDHREILNACRRCDFTSACTLLVNHICASGRSLTEAMKASKSETGFP